MSGEYRVSFCYEARDEGSRKKPFQIITTGNHGDVKKVSRLHEAGVVYQISLITSDPDPEDLLHALRFDGMVFVLKYVVDEVVTFTHGRFEEVSAVRIKSKREVKKTK